ncbi:MAG: hypothetical protein WCK65_09245 [Rhodospirillaceae bacterium]
MAVVAFDTLKLADRLQAGGFTAEQARTAAGAFADAMSGSDLATKHDLAELKSELRADLVEMEHHLTDKIAAVNARFEVVNSQFEVVNGKFDAVNARFDTLSERVERRTAETESRLIKWLLGVGVTAVMTIIGTGWTIIRCLSPLVH